jgi:hypothetical protein
VLDEDISGRGQSKGNGGLTDIMAPQSGGLVFLVYCVDCCGWDAHRWDWWLVGISTPRCIGFHGLLRTTALLAGRPKGFEGKH